MNIAQVYVVVSGEYSDFTVHGVFTSAERAEELRQRLSRPTDYQHSVETWPIDPPLEWFNMAVGKPWYDNVSDDPPL